MNVASLVLESAAARRDAPAIHFADGKRKDGSTRFSAVTNAELDSDSDAIAHGLGDLGVGRGVRCAVLVRPGLDLFTLTLALCKLGAVPVMIDPGIGARRMGRCLREARPTVFIGVPEAHVARILLRWGRDSVRTLVTAGRRRGWGGTTLDALRRAGRDRPAIALADTHDDDVAAILFTSGSTGPPKGVVYRHSNFVAQVEAVRGLGTIGDDEIDLATFPLFALFDPALGMTAVAPDVDPTRPARADPHHVIDTAESFGVTSMFGSPALLDTVGRWGSARGVKISTLRRVISAGAPVSASIMEAFLRMLPEGAEILTPYGATECLPVSCISSREVLGETAAQAALGAGVCVGAPVPSITLRIIRIDDRPIPAWRPELELPQGEIGEIVVRGPQATGEYDARPEATALAKIADADGGFWHRMGDAGYLDTRGRLWFCGRVSERVTTGEGTLYSVPCEGVFETHPAVHRAALVGVGPPGRAQPVLCIEPMSNLPRADRREVAQELLARAREHAHTRTIRTLLFRRSFPVDVRHNAKISRAELARWATGRLRWWRRGVYS